MKQLFRLLFFFQFVSLWRSMLTNTKDNKKGMTEDERELFGPISSSQGVESAPQNKTERLVQKFDVSEVNTTNKDLALRKIAKAIQTRIQRDGLKVNSLRIGINVIKKLGFDTSMELNKYLSDPSLVSYDTETDSDTASQNSPSNLAARSLKMDELKKDRNLQLQLNQDALKALKSESPTTPIVLPIERRTKPKRRKSSSRKLISMPPPPFAPQPPSSPPINNININTPLPINPRAYLGHYTRAHSHLDNQRKIMSKIL